MTGYALVLPNPYLPFPVALDLFWTARLTDWGSAFCGAPRDGRRCHATELRGAAFGLRQSLDTAGAFVGPLLGRVDAALGHRFPGRILVAVIPGFGCVVADFGCPEPESHFLCPTHQRW